MLASGRVCSGHAWRDLAMSAGGASAPRHHPMSGQPTGASLRPASLASSLTAGAAPHIAGTVLLWFRRDLRIADNPALIAALQTGAAVVRLPVHLTALPDAEPTLQRRLCQARGIRRSSGCGSTAAVGSCSCFKDAHHCPSRVSLQKQSVAALCRGRVLLHCKSACVQTISRQQTGSRGIFCHHMAFHRCLSCACHLQQGYTSAARLLPVQVQVCVGSDRGGPHHSVTASGYRVDSSVRMPEQVPVYVWAAEEEGQFQPGRCSRWWLHQSLRAFEGDLNALGARLVYRRAPESRVALLQLVEETGAQVPHASVNILVPTPFDRTRCALLPCTASACEEYRRPAAPHIVRQFCQSLFTFSDAHSRVALPELAKETGAQVARTSAPFHAFVFGLSESSL